MNVEQIGNWAPEDRLAMGGRPQAGMFAESDGQKKRLLQADFQQVVDEGREARAFEADPLENPSLTARTPPLPPLRRTADRLVRPNGGRVHRGKNPGGAT